ncbi:MAG TPA: PAS domain S-box protein, partial [Steroidobacteraceae bacterium]|nr:PAS domain S-box protein [Steroidobacteraceae bacterium]
MTNPTSMDDRVEAALRRSEASLAAAQSRAKIGSWEWVKETRAIAWSAEMLRILGRDPLGEPPTAAEAISMIHREDRHAFRRSLILAVTANQPFAQDVRIVGSDGEIRWLDCRGHVRREPAGNGLRMFATAQDITVRKQYERELERLNRLNMALSHVNQAIMRNSDRKALFQQICAVLVAKGGFRRAWIGWLSHKTRRLVPIAVSGVDEALASGPIYADDRPEGRGPTGTAFRQGKPYICNDVGSDPSTRLWRETLERHGLRSSAAFPISRGGKPRGILSVYSDEVGFFRDKEIALLQEAADDLSFALDHFASETARRRAQALVDRERLFTEAVFQSLPGVLYLYTEQGRFLRWNPSFREITGYTDEEITRMHPLDFFASTDKQRVARAIRVVFERGESSIEASFVAKDGIARPYFFTGRRVTFRGVPCLIGMGIDITIRKNAEAALEQYARRLQATSHRLLTVQETERRYLARELHDAVGQELTAISLNLTIIDDALPKEVAPKLRERLQDSQALLEE